MGYRSEFCGSDGKLQWRIFDANGNAVGYAASPQQADSLITLLSAAAPQVVADEREAFEAYLDSKNKHGLTNRDTFDAEYLAFMWKGWSERATMQAAPVQAQEPLDSDEIIVPMMPAHLLDFTGNRLYAAAYCMGFKAQAELRAPAQPVAVPDGWKLVPIKATGTMADAGAFSGLPVGAAEPWIAKQVWEAMAAQSPAAPAAQGDAKDVENERTAFESSAKARGYKLDRTGSGCYRDDQLQDAWSMTQDTLAQRAYAYGNFRAAIAAKAAS